MTRMRQNNKAKQKVRFVSSQINIKLNIGAFMNGTINIELITIYSVHEMHIIYSLKNLLPETINHKENGLNKRKSESRGFDLHEMIIEHIELITETLVVSPFTPTPSEMYSVIISN